MSAVDRRLRLPALFAVVFAGEMIFSLPFHVPRYFRPSVIEGLRISNAELGDVFAVYGVTAMLAYFPGGMIADRFHGSSLMCFALIATAAGGLYMATLPTGLELALLYGYWGVTSILLFWAAMIRATRQLGGDAAQGRAFGILDGGRGLAAALAASAAVYVFAFAVTGNASELVDRDRRAGLRAVVFFYTFATFVAAWLVRRYVGDDEIRDAAHVRTRETTAAVVQRQAIWLQAVIVVCAYCGYKGLDSYALYAVDALGMNEVDAARFAAMGAYARPIAALGAGLLADRVRATRVVAWLFLVLSAAYLGLATITPAPTLSWLIYANLIVTFFGVFGLRGVYFALLEETRAPRASTGRAVGLISLVGFTPDVFFAPLAGRLLDGAPGITGHRHYFLLLAVIAIGGLAAASTLVKTCARRTATVSRS